MAKAPASKSKGGGAPKARPVAPAPPAAAAPAMAAGRDPALDAVLSALRRVDPSFATFAENQFRAQIARGREAVPELIAALDDADVVRRIDAVEALGDLRDTRALRPLRKKLDDASPTVRRQAAVALVKIGDQQIFPEVVKSLRDPDPRLVVGAALILGHIGDQSVVPNLVEAFKTNNPEVGSAVAWALGRCGDERALPWLIAALRGGFVAANVCEALGRIGSPKATAPLIEALASAVDDVRAYAARALGMLRRDSGGKIGGLGVMARNQAAPALQKALQDPSKKVRLCAAIALFELGEKMGGKQLVRELTA
ncbi:MAG: HEAT repeat domain-containing protein [Deltaproteobacteria bacterium]|nr:HEAT repeat domain-containing protein [Deltaproteobacteria bacterium]